MSGFEVAGIVLGVLPLVITALSNFREGKGELYTLLKFKGLLDDLIHQLRIQKTVFYVDVLQLLRDARVSEILDEIDPPEERCIEVLRNVETGEEVKKYLGQLHQPFLDIWRHYERYLKEIACKLENIVRPQNASLLRSKMAAKDDLNAIIQANSDPKGHTLGKSRLKFVIDRKSLELLVNDLRREGESMGKLIKRVKTMREWEARTPSRVSTKMAQFFAQVQTRACTLYKAACQDWICDTHDQHIIMMRLENRIVKPHRTVQPTPSIVFRLCFPTAESMLHEIEVMARENEEASLNLPASGGLKGDTGNVPSISVTTACCGKSQVTSIGITNMCKNAHDAHKRGCTLALELGADSLAMREEVKTQQSFTATTTLESLLAAALKNQDARLTPMQQSLLALDLATAVLQLRHTSWCSSPWNKHSLKFLVESNGHVAVSAPFVEKAIGPGLLPVQLLDASRSTQSTKATVLELAILMLEILQHKSIEAWAAETQQGGTVTFGERFAVASLWLEESHNKLLPHHLEAVEQCLAQCVRGNLSWDFEFQKLYCENVIQPLQELIQPRTWS